MPPVVMIDLHVAVRQLLGDARDHIGGSSLTIARPATDGRPPSAGPRWRAARVGRLGARVADGQDEAAHASRRRGLVLVLGHRVIIEVHGPRSTVARR